MAGGAGRRARASSSCSPFERRGPPAPATRFSTTSTSRPRKRVKEIERTTNHDVKAVEYFIKERLHDDAELAPALEFVHFACTSEDINNLAYALMLGEAREQVMLPALDRLIATLRALAQRARGAADAVAHPRPDRLAHHGGQGNRQRRCAAWQRQRVQLHGVSLPGKINGAVGNYNAHVVAYPEVDWPALAQRFVESLGLEFNAYTTQIEPHDCIAEFCDAQRRINTIADRPVPRRLGLHLARLFQPGGEGRRSRLLDHAAQGQPDRFRERRRQLRPGQRAA